MTSFAPLPHSTQALLSQNTHPGLMLDKYAPSWSREGAPSKLSEQVQKPTVEAVVALSNRPPMKAADFTALRLQHQAALRAASEHTAFAGITTGPLTLHVARASALENAGICLHGVYGFVYLPGSGLKGMARAYAETVANADRDLVEAVFGNRPGEPAQERQHAGNVVFHDAWPTAWPKLTADIVNNHHQKYYAARDGDNENPPGDWENPVPVYFLAVPAGTTFEFVMGKRRDDVPNELLDQARQWLLGALCHLGAGAKTAAGYGSFKPAEEGMLAPPLGGSTRLAFETTLELDTPGFLAGANQQAEDCDLRPATLRGVLRWWWRTLHAGFMDVATLRRMEAAIWGDTNQGGAVRIKVVKSHDISPEPYDKRAFADMSNDEKSGPYGIPGSQPNKTTQGLWYASYGMDEFSRRDGRRQRCFLRSGAKWEVRLIARRSAMGLSAQQVLNQGTAALWLLCRFGGVGSKAGKGFGSLRADSLAGWDLDRCRRAAAECRQQAGLPNRFQEEWAASLPLERALPPLEIPFDWPNPWRVLDQVGFAYQTFAKKYAHRVEKQALGMPRRIGRQNQDREGRFEPTGPVRVMMSEARQARREDNVRHASPVRFHLARTASGFVVRVLAMPAAFLPDVETSRRFLDEFIESVEEDLNRRARLPMPAETTQRTEPTGPRRDRPRERGPQSPAPRASTRIPAISGEELKQRLAELSEGQAILRVQSATVTGYFCQLIKAAPKTNTGFQTDGSTRIMLRQAPGDLPEGTLVLVRRETNTGQFIEVLGRFPSAPPPPPRAGAGPRRR